MGVAQRQEQRSPKPHVGGSNPPAHAISIEPDCILTGDAPLVSRDHLHRYLLQNNGQKLVGLSLAFLRYAQEHGCVSWFNIAQKIDPSPLNDAREKSGRSST